MRKKVTRQAKRTHGRLSEVLGLLLLGVSAFIFLALISYDPFDISLNAADPNDPPHNYIGLVGAWYSFFVFFLFGLSSFLIPFFLGFLGIRSILRGVVERFWVWLGLAFLAMLSSSCLLELQWTDSLARWTKYFGLALLGPGGIGGEWILRRVLVKLIGVEGSYILLYSIFLSSAVFLLEIRLTKVGQFLLACLLKLFAMMAGFAKKIPSLLKAFSQVVKLSKLKKVEAIPVASTGKTVASVLYEGQRLETKVRRREIAEEVEEVEEERLVRREPKPPIREEKKMEKVEAAPKFSGNEKRIQLELLTQGDYQLPSLQLLEDIHSMGLKEGNVDDLARNAEILKTTLNEFGVEVEVSDFVRGPVITRYELQPAPGVKVQKIIGLSNDIALAMKAGSVRIIAPIPGKAAVGIEVPNTTSAMVSLKELLSSPEFRNASKRIPLVFGKDVSGLPIVADLTEMPHLLIAGATGSGKSICINSIILNILFYATPEYIRFLMVDPKMVELSIFNDIPHLALPVVTEAKKAAAALAWLVGEMERRYKVLAEVGVRNIEGLNERVMKEKVTTRSSDEPLKPMPYIVVVIDELADIMLVSSYEVENSIARLAQLSRAIGIHLILATQRPSVDVITGVIKANFPARISFQVASKVDSRTVLDGIGAEKLLGKGDMLYMPPGSSKLIRAQGAFVREAEIRRVLDFIRSQKVACNAVVNPEEIAEKTQSLSNDFNQMDDESLLQEAIKVIRNTQQASVSILQRKLRIGYSRAARIMDLLEEEGVVGPYKGSKARDILIDLETQQIEGG